jgi:DNA-binding protein H-NS
MAKTYAQISKELEALQIEAERVRKEESAEVIRKISEAISTYGITEQDLFGTSQRAAAKSAGKGARSDGGAPKYADGKGNVWGGMGPRPKWLREALDGGGKLEDFLGGASAEAGKSGSGAAAAEAAPEGGAEASSATSSSRKGGGARAAKKRRASQGFTDGMQSWSGMGPRPGWLKKALAAGRSLDEFRAR